MPGQKTLKPRCNDSGFAMISVLLVIAIFFIITVAISTYVVLQARINYEASMTDVSRYMADAGIKMASTRAIYRFFIRSMYNPDIYNPSPAYFYTYQIDMPPSASADYRASMLIQLYNLEPVAPAVDIYYNYRNTIRCITNIYDTSGAMLLAQRIIYADVYLGDNTSNPSQITQGLVKSKIKRYYDENR